MGLEVKNIQKFFGDPPTAVLKGVSHHIDDGEMVAITGRSGSGKSTLLYVMSTLDSPSSGEVLIDGMNMGTISEKQLHHTRNTRIGFVFQFHYLLPELTVLDNVLMPARKKNLEGVKKKEAQDLLQQVGLASKESRLATQLSGGEQQRVAIARALIMGPKYLFADEPTGNLDSVNGKIVMDLFKRINQEQKTTLVFVTHDEAYAKLAGREIRLADGLIQS